jgi:hypothetical protein
MPTAEVDPREDPRPYYASAFAIGIVGAAVMELLLWLARKAAWTKLNLGMTLGLASSYTLGQSPGAYVQGLTATLLCGGIFALCYAWIFEAWPHHTARAWLGALIGAAHAVVGGALLAVTIPLLNPGAGGAPGDSLVANPGFMAANYGSTTVAVFAALHVVFGALIGGWMHASPLATRHLAAVAAELRRGRGRPAST